MNFKLLTVCLTLATLANAASILFPKPLGVIVDSTEIATPDAGKTALLEEQLRQNKNARYQFSTDVDDHISDLTHTRSETRDGQRVEGSYSYSDGYTRRIVHYVADQNGYRVVKTESQPLDGPHVDLNGVASVSTMAHGNNLRYRVQSVPVEGPIAKVVDGDQLSNTPIISP